MSNWRLARCIFLLCLAWGNIKLLHADGTEAGVCASARLEIDQNAVLTRTAFVGELQVHNSSLSVLTALEAHLTILDATTNFDAQNRFDVYLTTDGLQQSGSTYILEPEVLGRFGWLIVPRREAATAAPQQYRIGGTLDYQDGPDAVHIDLFPSLITVHPDATLHVQYFHERDVD
jgi:hypothetical protein